MSSTAAQSNTAAAGTAMSFTSSTAPASSLPPPTVTRVGSGPDVLTILNWNVNGLRSISMRANPLPSLFAQYDADIVCFQETKISSWEDVSREHAFVPGYDSFFSFSRARKGWSGVATFVREGCTVAAAEDMDDPALDGEGRIMRTDHAGSGPERLIYKLAFYRAFEVQVRSLLAAGRHVVVVGDVNTAHRDMDNWAPAQFAGSSGCLPEERRWMDGLIRSDIHKGIVDERRQMQNGANGDGADGKADDVEAAASDQFDSSFLTTLPLTAAAGGVKGSLPLPSDATSAAGAAAAAAAASSAGDPVAAASSISSSFSSASDDRAPSPPPLIDSFRFFYPHRRHSFTFWDMRTSRRESNLGWRIDYMLVSTQLMLEHVCGAAIHAAQKGSDHCPTSLQLRLPPLPDEADAAGAPDAVDARGARLASFLGLSPFPHPTPALASKFRREFQVQSSTMLSFFKRAPSEPGLAVAKAAKEFSATNMTAAAPTAAPVAGKKRPAPKPTAASRARSLNSTLSPQQPRLADLFASSSPAKKARAEPPSENKESDPIVVDSSPT